MMILVMMLLFAPSPRVAYLTTVTPLGSWSEVYLGQRCGVRVVLPSVACDSGSLGSLLFGSRDSCSLLLPMLLRNIPGLLLTYVRPDFT